jgi:hypothetical protein
MLHSVAPDWNIYLHHHNFFSCSCFKSFKKEENLYSTIRMKDIRANFVCTICSETFTRRPTGERHSLNLHSGMAPIVRLIDYIVGRIEGRYQPSNPLLFRRKNKYMHRKNNSMSIDNCKNEKTVNEVSSQFTVMPDKTKESSQSMTRGSFKFGHKQDLFDIPTDNVGPKTDNIKDANQRSSHWSQTREVVYQKPSSSSYVTRDSRYLDKLVKFQEFATLVQKHYSKDTAKELIICASMLGPQNWERGGWIDETLDFLRKFDRPVT